MPANRIPHDILADKLGLVNALMSGDDAITPDSEQEVEDFKKAIEEKQRSTLPQVYMLKEEYDKLTPEFIRQQEEKNHCVIIPAEKDEIDRMRLDSIPYTAMPPMPKVPDIIMQDPYYGSHRGKPGGNKTPKIAPKGYAAKKKARRKQERKSRRNNHKKK